MLSGFRSEAKISFNIEDIAPLKVVDYIAKYSNRDLLGARMKGELPIPILDVFRYPIEVMTTKKNNELTFLILKKPNKFLH